MAGRDTRWRTIAAILCAGAAATASCSRESGPGLGEIMTLNQMRHAKLWRAGEAKNWPLAAYELDELQEGFDDVVKFHPTHKDVPLPLSSLVPKIMTEPLSDVRRAVDAKDHESFVVAYDKLTQACNACHQAAQFGFNVVKRPSDDSWFSNQDFQVKGNGVVRVESLIDELRTKARGAAGVDLWVPDILTLKGERVPRDVAMAALVDAVLSLGLMPDGSTEGAGGRTYHYKKQ